jgi:hypothetical protein
MTSFATATAPATASPPHYRLRPLYSRHRHPARPGERPTNCLEGRQALWPIHPSAPVKGVPQNRAETTRTRSTCEQARPDLQFIGPGRCENPTPQTALLSAWRNTRTSLVRCAPYGFRRPGSRPGPSTRKLDPDPPTADRERVDDNACCAWTMRACLISSVTDTATGEDEPLLAERRD